MKRILSLILILFILDVQAQSLSEIETLEINFKSRESVSYGKISYGIRSHIKFSIQKNENKHYAILSNTFHCGTIKEPEWKKEINDDILIEIQHFAKRLELIPSEVKEFAYVTNQYQINYLGRNFSLIMDASTDTLQFEQLYSTIFSQELESLHKSRNDFSKEMENDLKKNWYFNPRDLESLKIDSILILSTEKADLTSCYWVFSDGLAYTENCEDSDSVESIASIEYIDGMAMIYMNYQNRFELNSARPYYSFEIISLNENTLKLKVYNMN